MPPALWSCDTARPSLHGKKSDKEFIAFLERSKNTTVTTDACSLWWPLERFALRFLSLLQVANENSKQHQVFRFGLILCVIPGKFPLGMSQIRIFEFFTLQGSEIAISDSYFLVHLLISWYKVAFLAGLFRYYGKLEANM